MDIQNQSYSEIVAKMAAKHREIELLAAFKKAEEQIKKNYEKEQEDRIKDIKEDLEDDFYTLVIEEAKLKIQLEEIQILEEKSEKQREEAMEKAKKEYEEMYSQLPMYMQAELPKVEMDSDKTFSHPVYTIDEIKQNGLFSEQEIIYCESLIKNVHNDENTLFSHIGEHLIRGSSEDVVSIGKTDGMFLLSIENLKELEKIGLSRELVEKLITTCGIEINDELEDIIKNNENLNKKEGFEKLFESIMPKIKEHVENLIDGIDIKDENAIENTLKQIKLYMGEFVECYEQEKINNENLNKEEIKKYTKLDFKWEQASSVSEIIIKSEDSSIQNTIKSFEENPMLREIFERMSQEPMVDEVIKLKESKVTRLSQIDDFEGFSGIDLYSKTTLESTDKPSIKFENDSSNFDFDFQ